MQRYLAFLRGINVGGHTVKMDRLRAVFVEMGFVGVETFIASGNVIFESATFDAEAHERAIEEQLRRALGYDVATFIRSNAELAAIASRNLFADGPVAPEVSLYVAFVHAPPPQAAWEKLQALSSPRDEFRLADREIYWRCHTRMSDSPVFTGGLFEKALAVPLTIRSMTTVRKIAAKYGGADDRAR